MSSGGAFLQTKDDVRVGAVVMMVPKQQERRSAKAMLIGSVVRKQEAPVAGVGIRWARCMSNSGIQHLFDFLAYSLRIHPGELPVPGPEVARSASVAYDLVTKSYSIPSGGAREEGGRVRWRVDVVQPSALEAGGAAGEDEATEQDAAMEERVRELQEEERAGKPMEIGMPRELAVSPGQYMRTGKMGALTVSLGTARGRVQADIPVSFETGGRRRLGVVRLLGTMSLLIVTWEEVVVVEGEAMVVTLPVPLGEETTEVRLRCNVQRVGGSGSPVALDLRVSSAESPLSPGLYERYVKYLYQKLLTEG